MKFPKSMHAGTYITNAQREKEVEALLPIARATPFAYVETDTLRPSIAIDQGRQYTAGIANLSIGVLLLGIFVFLGVRSITKGFKRVGWRD